MKASEMEVDGETALKLNSSFLFAAFNNKELRLQMMECKFPMGVSNGDENQIVCVIPGTNVTSCIFFFFLVAKQVHCYILSKCHWSLLVLINSDDPEVPSSFLSVDHLQYHNNAIHVNNLNW
jgi:hypothetical protein